MSNKDITYGQGKDIDPTKLQERLDKGFMHYPEQKLWGALQQREERKEKEIQKIKQIPVHTGNFKTIQTVLNILEGKE